MFTPFAVRVLAALALPFLVGMLLAEVRARAELREEIVGEASQAEIAAHLEGWRSTLGAPLLSSERLIEGALMIRALALRLDDGARRAHYGCEALRALARVEAREPLFARAVVLRALFQQVLVVSPLDCQAASVETLPERALRATRLQPRSTGVAFAAALVLLNAGDAGAAVPLLRMVLAYSTTLERSRQAVIEQVIVERGLVKELIPPKFPQILGWSYRIRNLSPELWKGKAQELGELQQQALAEARSRNERSELDDSVYQQFVLDLLPVLTLDGVRRELDRQLALLCHRRGDQECSLFFRARSELQRLHAIPGYRVDDMRPLAGSLQSWGSGEQITLDTRATSVGFFLPPTEGLDLIILQSKALRAALTPASLGVYASNDNISWHEVELARSPQRVQIRQQVLYALEPRETAYRFWKVTFRDKRVIGSFSNMLPELITAYGQTSREGAQ